MASAEDAPALPRRSAAAVVARPAGLAAVAPEVVGAPGVEGGVAREVALEGGEARGDPGVLVVLVHAGDALERLVPVHGSPDFVGPHASPPGAAQDAPAQRRSASPVFANASSSGGGSSSAANQRSSATSSAATGSPAVMRPT